MSGAAGGLPRGRGPLPRSPDRAGAGRGAGSGRAGPLLPGPSTCCRRFGSSSCGARSGWKSSSSMTRRATPPPPLRPGSRPPAAPRPGPAPPPSSKSVPGTGPASGCHTGPLPPRALAHKNTGARRRPGFNALRFLKSL